jgi:RNA polymerase sigma factor (sigma-70 family)
MPYQPLAVALRRLLRVAQPQSKDQPSDGQLLQRFTDEHDESAFEAIVQRHGTMVWNVCRRVLANSSDADDAFQAAFLVLVRKAKQLAGGDSIAGWLHVVAHRISLDARSSAVRRRKHESQGSAMLQGDSPAGDQWSEVRQVLDDELRRLPEKYRAPLVLCYLEGKTNDEAADQLGWTRGTIAGRLSRARDVLRGRLARRGLALAPAVLVSTLAQNAATAAVPSPVMNCTVKAALGHASASAPALSLAEGALRTMLITKIKTAAVVLTALTIVGTGAGILLHQAFAKDSQPNAGMRAGPAFIVLANDPTQLKGDGPTLVKGNTTFACDLYARLREKDGNFFTSPYSISTALAMTYAGARGQTAEEMANAMHFTLPQERLHPAAGALVRDLSGGDKKRGYQLSVANSLWGQKNYGFLVEFVKLNQTCYGAGFQEVDFINAREQARKTINTWVEKQTQDKIKDLLKEDHLTPATRLVLTNAIYFKAEWETKFYRAATREGPFQVTSQRKVNVPTMNAMATFPYLDGGTFDMLELPYKERDLSMLILLPKKVDGLAEFEKSLTADKLGEWHSKLRASKVQLSLPKFKMTSEFELAEQLQAMGMTLAFDSRRADFSGMNGGSEPLSISAVVHKTFVDVNEEGTEAAGATAVVMGFTGAPPRKEVEFRADHPFVFLVRDNRSGSILFLGRVVDPSK